MYRLLALAFLMAVLGCAEKPTSLQADGEPFGDSTAKANEHIDLESSVRHNDDSLEYPERADVVRLLVRASELESNGEFQDALVVANEAVANDPSSPKANKMKARLEELLLRIQNSPDVNERTEASTVVQRNI